ncbi:L-arabinose 1-dehydrogenase (NAD(P)(+)) [uncultured archaeon]|nr:L-arabinose 1-dehydrogenase (NAD(P)(+)) [uncultured archaeon]
MTILVTGAAGFIGSHTTEKLLNVGHEIVGIDDLNDYYDPKQKQENLNILSKNKKFTFIKADIRDAKTTEETFKKHKPTAVIHLAARAGVRPSLLDPALYMDVNVKGTVHLLEAARKNDVKTFIFGSSSSVYGANTKTPFSEKDPVEQPISPYAATKRAGELLTKTYHNLYNLNTTSLRFFTVYGPRGRPDMAVYTFTKNLLEKKPITVYGDGTSSRDYTYVSDVVDGIISALNKSYPDEIFNLGESQTVTLNKLIQTIEKETNKKAIIERKPLQPGDVTTTYADLTHSKQKLGYNPQVKIEEGIHKFVQWYNTK